MILYYFDHTLFQVYVRNFIIYGRMNPIFLNVTNRIHVSIVVSKGPEAEVVTKNGNLRVCKTVFFYKLKIKTA